MPNSSKQAASSQSVTSQSAITSNIGSGRPGVWRGFGWGLFGVAITPKVAIATLVLHLIYGAALEWGLGRKR